MFDTELILIMLNFVFLFVTVLLSKHSVTLFQKLCIINIEPIKAHAR